MGVPDWIDDAAASGGSAAAPMRRIFVIPENRRLDPFEVRSLDEVDKTGVIRVAVFPSGMPDGERDVHLKTLRSRWTPSAKTVRKAGVELYSTRRSGPVLYAAMILGGVAQIMSIQLVGLGLVTLALAGGLMSATLVSPTMDARAPAKSFLAYEALKSRADVSPDEIDAGKKEMALYKAHVAEMEKREGSSK